MPLLEDPTVMFMIGMVVGAGAMLAGFLVGGSS
ncbi:hypothetical protein C7402_115243 [Paraburkholderia unamae]|uniref:Uncharacterized protein n=1 Tax=Paraburkholderia unamae TaxID=219649 RepID=A0ABX5KFM1_9BURK|nr:hypothetical protein C7402_115243 [Paraburkholderia unamae]